MAVSSESRDLIFATGLLNLFKLFAYFEYKTVSNILIDTYKGKRRGFVRFNALK